MQVWVASPRRARIALAALSALWLGCSHVLEVMLCRSDPGSCKERFARERAARAQRPIDGRACDAGDAEACSRAAHFDEEYGYPEDALLNYERACGARIAAACVGAGLLLREGRGARRDAARALARFRRACELEYREGCAAAAATTADPRERAAFQERGCLLGSAELCAPAGDFVAETDPSRAQRLYRIGCAVDSAAACASLGRLAVRP
jgi:uncharacterized protein